MRLAFFTHGGVLYGANLSMIDLILGLRARGIECLVIHAHRGPIEERLRQLGISAAYVRFESCVHWKSDKPWRHPRRWISEAASWSRAIRKQAFNARQLDKLVDAAREFGASAIVSNASETVVGLDVARHLQIPHIWHIREFGDLDWDFSPDFGFSARRRAFQASAGVVFISDAVANHHLKQCSLGADMYYRIVYNAIASSRELSERALVAECNGKEGGPFIFAITGFVKYSKGQFDAVSALAKLVERGFDARLVVAGQGAIEELRKHAEALGIAHWVDIRGHVADLGEVYRQSDCGLMCSRAEGFGRVTAEFMSWGKPVIGRDSGATPEIVEHEVNGLLYNGEIGDLVRCMERILGDEDLAQRLGRKALERAASRFSHDTNAEEFIRAIEPVVPSVSISRQPRP